MSRSRVWRLVELGTVRGIRHTYIRTYIPAQMGGWLEVCIGALAILYMGQGHGHYKDQEALFHLSFIYFANGFSLV